MLCTIRDKIYEIFDCQIISKYFKKAKSASLTVRASQLFNLLPVILRNSEHGDVALFKNHLDIYPANIPDQPIQSIPTSHVISGPGHGYDGF